jgi:hypothetical protein
MALAAAGWAQSLDDVVFRQNFQGDTGTWMAMGEGAKVAPAADAHGLVFTYELAPKMFSGVVSPAPSDLAKAQRIRFRVKTDHATAVGLILSEKKPAGGNYSAWFWSPANTWQWIEFTPADFTLNDGANDPKDADNKLDLDEVEGMGLFDLGQFFGRLGSSGDLPLSAHVDEGQHSITVESFELLNSPEAASSGMRIGTLDRNFLDWATPGGMNLKLTRDNPLKGPALEASYEQTEGQFQLLVRRMAGVELSKAKRLVFDIASDKEVTLMVSVEMNKAEGGQGQRFTLPVFPPGGKEVFHVDVSLADFKGDGTFDPSRWRTLAILDISTASGGTPGPNTIWIGNLEATEK